jgi:nicotinate-nucleotide--dimethylbenzimidazole phosphoribosyltransferase
MGLLEDTIKSIRPLDTEAMTAAKARQDTLTKPLGALGRLEALSVQLAGIQGKAIPQIKNKAVFTMAADHGVVAEGISAYPQEVTAQMVYNFLNGGAGINVMARQVGARVIVIDMGVATELKSHAKLMSIKIGHGTKNICRGPAMTEAEAVKAIETGIKILETEIHSGLDIVGTGDMGIGNTTSSSAICAVMTGRTVAEVTGKGAGLEKIDHKVKVIVQALKINCPDKNNAIDVLAKVGGFEIGGLAGVMLGAAAHRVPVVLDGFISGAAALIAVSLTLNLKDYLVAGHVSAEPGHRLLLQHLALRPLLDLEMRLGEGTGAALGISLCETAACTLAEMATFSEAGVSERSEA